MIMRVRIGELRRIIRSVLLERAGGGEVGDFINDVLDNPDDWHDFMHDDFIALSQGEEIPPERRSLYPGHWEEGDFDAVIYRLDTIWGYA